MAISSPTFRPPPSVLGTEVNTFNEITSVASGSEVQIASYTVPVGVDCFIERITASGTNIAKYSVFINGTKIDSGYTNHATSLSQAFDFSSQSGGMRVLSGDIVAIKVIHSRLTTGDFNARIQVTEV